MAAMASLIVSSMLFKNLATSLIPKAAVTFLSSFIVVVVVVWLVFMVVVFCVLLFAGPKKTRDMNKCHWQLGVCWN